MKARLFARRNKNYHVRHKLLSLFLPFSLLFVFLPTPNFPSFSSFSLYCILYSVGLFFRCLYHSYTCLRSSSSGEQRFSSLCFSHEALLTRYSNHNGCEDFQLRVHTPSNINNIRARRWRTIPRPFTLYREQLARIYFAIFEKSLSWSRVFFTLWCSWIARWVDTLGDCESIWVITGCY